MSRRSWGLLAALGLALVFAAAAVLVAAGGDRATAEPNPRTPGSTSADAGFARDMSTHHQQAVEMSFIVRDRTSDDEVRRLAYDIANTQANQRGMMLGWLDLWGLPKNEASQLPMAWMGMGMEPGADGALMPGMATTTDLDRLRGLSGKDAEVLYLQLMTEHHKGGIHMAQGCVERCTVGPERRLAQGMVSAQQSEIDLMAQMLRKRGASPRSN
ncbi:DUF305 domain-containing protein [Streptomyces sp. NBC_00083]|uniref:DUF305 domain-containing protein n=1 Tax=Streptomyces sp. NBC_00083 TaxID=2975647 RepID=UPI002251C338|nr:DUF305 domain-containing protein [Streptomyces sp. NBC_00083]MCX5382799.1 DUF305 domain-containing protein [Streptomyces sp. NBC_00083]